MKCGVKLLQCLLVATLSTSVASIDPVQEIGYCKRLALPPDSSLIYANEGVWFPQYRTQSTGARDYSCHILYEGLSRSHEDSEVSLKQISYYSVRGEPKKNPKTTVFDQTGERGVYSTDEFISGFGMATIYHEMIKLSPDVRLRYVCTNSTKIRQDIDLIYIETRRAIGLASDVMEGIKTLTKAGLKATLIKIDQNNCTRPISSIGYDESMFFDES